MWRVMSYARITTATMFSQDYVTSRKMPAVVPPAKRMVGGGHSGEQVRSSLVFHAYISLLAEMHACTFPQCDVVACPRARRKDHSLQMLYWCFDFVTFTCAPGVIFLTFCCPHFVFTFQHFGKYSAPQTRAVFTPYRTMITNNILAEDLGSCLRPNPPPYPCAFHTRLSLDRNYPC